MERGMVPETVWHPFPGGNTGRINFLPTGERCSIPGRNDDKKEDWNETDSIG